MKIYKIILISLIALSLLICLSLLINFDPSLLAISSKIFWAQLWLLVGAISGFMGSILLVWEMLLGSRYLVGLFTKDIIWVNKLHNWIGKYGLVLILIHPITEMLAYFEGVIWIFLPNFSSQFEIYLSLGKIAFILILIIWITSILLKDKLKFRPWLYIHYISYPLIIFVLLHAYQNGTYINDLILLKNAWLILIVIMSGITLLRLIQAAGVMSYKYSVSRIDLLSNGLYIIAFTPLKSFIKPLPGSYIYIQKQAFGETHPFSFMRYDAKTNELVFAIKNIGPFTRDLMQAKVGDKYNLDGPYGVFTQESKPDDSINIYLAGGIGITPFVQRILDSTETNYLFNSNQYLANALSRNELKAKLASNYYDCITREKVNAANVFNSRFNIEILNSVVPQNILSKANFYICGNKQFIENIESILNIAGIKSKRIHSEKFF
jgi:predicted ferric reductase